MFHIIVQIGINDTIKPCFFVNVCCLCIQFLFINILILSNNMNYTILLC